MKRFILTTTITALGVIFCSPKVNLATMINSTPTQSESLLLYPKVNTNSNHFYESIKVQNNSILRRRRKVNVIR
jgi:hypothetical protein